MDRQAGSASVDIEMISRVVDNALALQLDTSTRVDIELRAKDVRDALRKLVTKELGADEDSTVRGLFRRAYEVLDRQTVPRSGSPVFAVFAHMRETAAITRRLLWVWEERDRQGDR